MLASSDLTIAPPPTDLSEFVLFSKIPYVASDRGGTVDVVLMRLDPAAAAQVEVGTGDGTALAGVDYQSVHQVVTFQAGQTTQTVSIPILAHPGGGERQFAVAAADPTTHQIIGLPTTVTLVDRADVTPPVIDNIHVNTHGRALTGLSLHFSKPMDPATVQDPRLYSIVRSVPFSLALPPPRRRVPSPPPVIVRSATYEPATNAVILRTAAPLRRNTIYDLTIFNGTTSLPGDLPDAGLKDAAGNTLDGDRNGAPGGFFYGSIGRGTRFRFTGETSFDAGALASQDVRLTLRGGGSMDVVDRDSLRINDARPGRTVVRGRAVAPVPVGPYVFKQVASVEPNVALRLDPNSIRVDQVLTGPGADLTLTGPAIPVLYPPIVPPRA